MSAGCVALGLLIAKMKPKSKRLTSFSLSLSLFVGQGVMFPCVCLKRGVHSSSRLAAAVAQEARVVRKASKEKWHSMLP